MARRSACCTSWCRRAQWVARRRGREARARAAKRGLWAHPAFAVRAADRVSFADAGTFQLVQGRVRDVAEVGGRTYLNFGPDWRTDFTVTIAEQDRKLFAEGALDAETLRGAQLRVRGYVEWLNGPMIAVTHPDEIERVR